MSLSPAKKKALYKRTSSPMFWAAVIAAMKVALSPFGVTFIRDEDVDAVANGLSTLIILLGIFWGYGEDVEQTDGPQ